MLGQSVLQTSEGKEVYHVQVHILRHRRICATTNPFLTCMPKFSLVRASSPLFCANDRQSVNGTVHFRFPQQNTGQCDLKRKTWLGIQWNSLCRTTSVKHKSDVSICIHLMGCCLKSSKSSVIKFAGIVNHTFLSHHGLSKTLSGISWSAVCRCFRYIKASGFKRRFEDWPHSFRTP